MRLPLRWKIALAFTALSAFMLAALYLYLHAVTMQSITATTEQGLLVTARVMARQLPPPPWKPSSALQSLVKELDWTSQTRLTLIDPAGKVVADSREAPAGMENHANRLERLRALSQGWGVAVHMSRTLRMPMIYVALAVDGAGDAKWVLRLSRPVTEVQAASQRLQQVMLVAVAIAAGLVWLLSLALAGSLTRPVRHLVRVARRINKGDLQARAEQMDDPELGQLSEVFNSALDSLATHAATADRESRYYSAILQQMGDAVVIVDQRGHVEFINPVFARLFGVEGETVQGRTAEEITLNYELSSLLMRAVEQKAVQHDEVRLLHPETRQLATIVTPLTDDEGAVVGAIG
ncbi:MAG: PAS domain-containing protein, partial [Armatimonadia bacterium]